MTPQQVRSSELDEFDAIMSEFYFGRHRRATIATATAKSPHGLPVVLVLTSDCLAIHYEGQTYTAKALGRIAKRPTLFTCTTSPNSRVQTRSSISRREMQDWRRWNGSFSLERDKHGIAAKIQERQNIVVTEAKAERIRKLEEQLEKERSAS